MVILITVVSVVFQIQFFKVYSVVFQIQFFKVYYVVFQIQFLIQECGTLLSKPNFVSTLCFAIESPLHHQKVQLSFNICIPENCFYLS